MEPIALMIALLIGQPLLAADKKPQVVPNSAEVKAAIERDIRQLANKPTGELTKADLEKAQSLLCAKHGPTAEVRIYACDLGAVSYTHLTLPTIYSV